MVWTCEELNPKEKRFNFSSQFTYQLDTFTFHNSPVTTPSTPHSAKSKPDKQPEKKPEKKPQEPPPQPQNSKTKMFGVDIAEVMKREHETEDMPKLLKQMFEFLEPKGTRIQNSNSV